MLLIFCRLTATTADDHYRQVGRCMATLLSDDIFKQVAYNAQSTDELIGGINEFLEATTVLPPGAWDPKIRIEPPQKMPCQKARRKTRFIENIIDSDEEEEREREATGLKRTGRLVLFTVIIEFFKTIVYTLRLFGGLVNDVKRKLPWYLSDFKDAFALQTVASVFFLYFACLSPIITFGGLMSQATHNNIVSLPCSILTESLKLYSDP